MDDEALVQEIAAEIAAYLDAHPHAAETRDGVFECWILHERFMRGFRALDRALNQLMREGRLETVQLADGGLLYRGVRDRRD